MENNKYVDEADVDNSNGFLAALLFVTGLLFGALAGSAATLLMAPQSGKKTRLQIRRKGRHLRKQTEKAVDDGLNQVRDKAQDISTSIQAQAEDLQKRGQDVVDHQKERWSPVIEASVTAVQG